MKKVVVFAFLIGLLSGACKKDSGWISLFDGHSLHGWHRVGGEAQYLVEDNAITGVTVMHTENSFLCTDSVYGDFILELDVKVDDRLNSGIQIRSNSYPDYKNGRFHGYQVEIDPDPVRARFWSGGIYDEARRGWLYDLSENEPARKAFKNNAWNRYRIEAIGDTIKTWINGVPAAYIIDNVTPSGYIGLQVHSIGNDSTKNHIKVQWKNIRIMTDPQMIAKNSTPSPLTPKVYLYNQLTQEEKAAGWKLLFDGKTTNGWKGAYRDSFPKTGWIVRDQAITVLESGGGEAQHGGDIVTLDMYKNFELSLEFAITEGANSGIKYYVTEKEEGNPGSAFGLEFQILDDEKHPDAQCGTNGNRTMGSLYDLIAADTAKVVKKIGEWNHARIVSKDNHVEHWLNGVKVVEYERGSTEYRKRVAKSKYADPKYNTHGPFGEAEEGRILLQDHGNTVSFRNIKIREL